MEQTQPINQEESATAEANAVALREYLADPEKQKNAIIEAHFLHHLTKGNWFLPEFVARKVKKSKDDAAIKLTLLQLFGLVVTKVGLPGTKHSGKLLYKVTLTEESRLFELDQLIGFYKAQITILEQEKSKIINKATSSDTQKSI